jgi:hypothetical protein
VTATGAPDTRLTDARDECDEHLAAIERWSLPELRRLTDAEREFVQRRIDELSEERESRSEAHRERLASKARHFGREVAQHRMLLPDAQRRLESLALTTDPESLVPILLVPYRESIQIIEGAFVAAFTAASARFDVQAVA